MRKMSTETQERKTRKRRKRRKRRKKKTGDHRPRASHDAHCPTRDVISMVLMAGGGGRVRHVRGVVPVHECTWASPHTSQFSQRLLDTPPLPVRGTRSWLAAHLPRLPWLAAACARGMPHLAPLAAPATVKSRTKHTHKHAATWELSVATVRRIAAVSCRSRTAGHTGSTSTQARVQRVLYLSGITCHMCVVHRLIGHCRRRFVSPPKKPLPRHCSKAHNKQHVTRSRSEYVAG